jgi:hypothetical protein
MVHLKDTRLLRALHAHFSRRRIVRRVTHERLLGSSQDEHPAAVYCIDTRCWPTGGVGHAPPCSGMRAPCEAPGRLGRHLPSAGSGPASAARRMGRAWARMGHGADSLACVKWHAPPMQRHAYPMRGVRAAGPTLPVGPQRARASRAPHGPRMGPHGPWCRPSCVCEMACAPMQRHAYPMRGVRAAGPTPPVGRLRACASADAAWAAHGPAWATARAAH